MRRLSLCAAVCFLVVPVGAANASILGIVGDLGDGQIGSDGSVAGIAQPRDRTGTGGDNRRGLALIYFFALPTLSPSTTIINAELELEYVEKTNVPEFNIDLFGIDARPSATFDAGDYYDGAASSSSDALVQSSLITPSTSLGNLTVANSDLLDFVNSLYNVDGTPVSTFATFRVNPDKDVPVGSAPIRGYFLALADHGTASFRPRLTLTTTDPNVIPEPTTLIIWSLLAALGLCAYPRRRRRAA